jgi:hypothetical protein
MKNAASAASIAIVEDHACRFGLVEVASDAACARKPSVGSGEKTFCHPAVSVAAVSHTSGAP